MSCLGLPVRSTLRYLFLVFIAGLILAASLAPASRRPGAGLLMLLGLNTIMGLSLIFSQKRPVRLGPGYILPSGCSSTRRPVCH